METIYQVKYSEQTGFYVSKEKGVSGLDGFSWYRLIGDDEDDEITFHKSDGWARTVKSAVEYWRAEIVKVSNRCRDTADQLLLIANGPSPVVPKVRIMKPDLFRVQS